MSILETAIRAYEANICVVPAKQDGSKRPDLISWTDYQKKRPPLAQVRGWFSNGRTGIGIIPGRVSANLEAFEFDCPETFDAFLVVSREVGLGEVVRRIRTGYQERTPSGGVHWLYRCDEIAGNSKLAQRPDGGDIKVLIETRGQGGFLVTAPSYGKVHPTGRPYVLELGGFGSIVTITPDERRQLWDLARTFDQMPVREEPPRGARSQPSDDAGSRPGDDFNSQVDWRDVLEPHGWRLVFMRGDVGYWRRPGKRDGWSATTNHAGSDLFYIFSTSTELEAHRGYSKFSVYALLTHRGDFAAAARELGAKGFGDQAHIHVGRNGRGGDGRPDDAIPTDRDAHQFPPNDSGNAEHFAHLYGDRLRYDHARDRWLLWNDHFWRPDTTGEVMRLVKDAARRRYHEATAIEDLKERQRVAEWAIKSESRSRRDSTLYLARTEHPLADSGEDWDRDPWLLGVANGVVDLRTGLLRPGRQDDRITMRTGVAFDPAARAPRWEDFLTEIFDDDQELIDWIWRAVGYSITGDTSEEVLFICWGKGRNGKSKLLTALGHALGEYAHNMPFSALELQHRAAIPADVAALVGRRFVISSETTEGVRLNEGRVKALTGNDPITARFLHENFFTFRPVGKYWLAVNHRPVVRDDSEGFWARIRMIPFLKRFVGDAADKDLEKKLKAEAPGILTWGVRGAVEWQRRGLEPPDVVVAATNAYQTESDPLGQFIAERCVIRPDVSVPAAELYKAYRAWAEDQGFKDRETLTNTMFGRRMGERFTKEHGRGGKSYYGVGLATREEQP